MRPTPKEIEALVVAVLSVSNFAATRTATLVPGLERERILDVDHVAAADIGSVVVALTRGGYERGFVNGIVAPRLISLMQAVRDGSLDAIGTAVKAGERDRVINALRRINGIGPHVAQTAWALLHALHAQQTP